jgi:hypothetical protein
MRLGGSRSRLDAVKKRTYIDPAGNRKPIAQQTAWSLYWPISLISVYWIKSAAHCVQYSQVHEYGLYIIPGLLQQWTALTFKPTSATTQQKHSSVTQEEATADTAKEHNHIRIRELHLHCFSFSNLLSSLMQPCTLLPRSPLQTTGGESAVGGWSEPLLSVFPNLIRTSRKPERRRN